MNLRRIVVFTAPLLSSAALVAVGCVIGDLGGDAIRSTETQPEVLGEPCADDPFKCKAGTTCWPTAGDAGAMCVPSKAYKTKGSECELLLGRSSCADGLVCITVNKALDAGPDTGKDTGPKPTSEPLSLCATWCDERHPCAAGEECRSLSLEGFPARACVPNDLTPPDTGVPDTAKPDTNKPDTYKPPTDTSVEDTTTPEDTSTPPVDTSPPPDTSTPSDTSMPDTSMPDTTTPGDVASD